MILRLVVGVVLTATLVGVAAPAMSDASADAADSSVDRQVTALADRLQRLVATSDPTRGPGARHVTTLRLPEQSVTSAAVGWLRFESRAGVGVATWRVEASTASQRLVGVPLRAAGGNLTFRAPGPHRLAFEFRSRANESVVTIRRLGEGTP